MNADQMIVGARVRLINTIYDQAPHPGQMIARIAAGFTGSIVAAYPDADPEMGEHCAEVLFDQHLPQLEDWDNVLHVWAADGDVLPSDFELIPA